MIRLANLNPGPDVINFAIPGTGGPSLVKSIKIGSALPAITDPLTIDGRTQPGYTSSPLIELDGSTAPAGTHGLRVNASDTTIQGLSIVGFKGSGIRVVSSSNTSILSNYIGVPTSSSPIGGNGDSGVYIDNSSNTAVGGVVGTTLSQGNVISGNTGNGVTIVGPNAANNRILANFIGTSNSGSSATPNSGNGVSVDRAINTRIGGKEPGEGNVISGNINNGIALASASTTNTLILGNFIGVDGNPSALGGGTPRGGFVAVPNGGAGISNASAVRTVIGGVDAGAGNIISGNKGAGIDFLGGDNAIVYGNIIGADLTGTKNLGNLGAGISINGSNGIQIGATTSGAANIIAWNGQPLGSGGVNIAAGRRNSILSNSIFSNFGLGIILFSANGQPVPNDPGDGDSGPNDLQNYPVLTQAATAAGRTLIRGTFNSRPNGQYLIQFFASPNRDPQNFGEGQGLLGEVTVTTDSQGNAKIFATLNSPSAIDSYVSSTATDSLGNTSGFSSNIQAVQANQADLSIDIAPTSIGTLGSNFNYNITVTNNGPDPATNIEFSMLLDQALSFAGSSQPGITLTSPGIVSGTLPTLAPFTPLTFTVSVQANSIGLVTSTASVSLEELDSNISNNTDTETTRISVPVDLGITLNPKPASVTVGEEFVIDVFVTNYPREDISTSEASNVTAVITLPEGLTFVSAATGQGTVTALGNKVTAQIGIVPKSATRVVKIRVQAPIDVPPGNVLNVTSVVTSSEIEPGGVDPHPRTDSLPITILPSSDVSLTFTGSPDPVLVGANLTLDYRVINSGPSPATGVVFSYVLPSTFELISLSTPSQGTVTFETSVDGVVTVRASLGDLGDNTPATGSIVVRPTAMGRVPSTASVMLDQPDPNPSNNIATFTASVSPADLVLTGNVSPNPVEIGSNLTYTYFVTNAGPADATGVSFLNVLPQNVDFVSVSSSSGQISELLGTVSGNLGTIPVGVTVTVTIVVTPRTSTVLSTNAIVAADQIDIRPEDNFLTTNTNVSPTDLGVQLLVTPNLGLAGDPVTLTATVTNNGPFAATNVIFSSPLPDGFSYVSSITSQGTVGSVNSMVLAAIGGLAPGASAMVVFVVMPSSAGSYTFNASVSGDQIDPIPSNNNTQAVATVFNSPGVLSFSSPVFAAAENSGSALITVRRSGGNMGTVTVRYTATPGSALAGVNFTPVSGVLTFADGEISKTFSVPIISDGVVRNDQTVVLTISSPGGDATLGENATAVLIIQESNQDVTGPKIIDVINQGQGRTLQGVSIVFDEPLDPARAMNPANYTLYVQSRNGRGESQIAFNTPVYDVNTNTVTITAAGRMALNTMYRVVVNGGVQDIHGNRVQGDGVVNGSEYTAYFARGNALRYADGDGDAVSLNLSRGGLADLTRDASGEGLALRMLRNTRRTVLTGNVRQRFFSSNGITTFSTITGAGFAGRVSSRLTTPKFFSDDVTAAIRGRRGATVQATEFSPRASLLSVRRWNRRLRNAQ